ncbi:hypothetical protein DYB32_005254 [Aphanomyces invadans]|uniref:Uncharacterized protein n=1 Tax=Aphanomyces invadans TaxID=157072 RepID=A0A3R6VCI7_9STRA|nr:hypothetical protein DYB32_005254 [Aphanomyces invadans]
MASNCVVLDNTIVLANFCWAKKLQQSLVRKFTTYYYKWTCIVKEQDVAHMTIVINTNSLPNNGAAFHMNGYLCPAHIEKPDPSFNVMQHIRAANKTYFGQVSRYDEDIDGEFTAPWGVGTWPADDSKWPESDRVGKQELEIVHNDEHICFTVH